MRKKQAKAKRESATMEELATRQGNGRRRGHLQNPKGEGRIKKYPPLAQIVLLKRAKEIADALEAYVSVCQKEAMARIDYIEAVRRDGIESEVEDSERRAVRNCYALGASMLCLDRLAEKEPLAFVAGSALLLSWYDQDICRSVAEDQAFAFIRTKRDMAIDGCEESLDKLVAIQEEVARLCAESAGGMAADAAICKTPKGRG